MAKHDKRDKRDKEETYGVGWVFFVICFLLSTGPSIYFTWFKTYEDRRGLFPVIIGLVLAGLVAGLITWAVNSVWYAIASRLYKAKQKKSKKA